MRFAPTSTKTPAIYIVAGLTALSAPVCYYVLLPIFMWNHMLVAGIIALVLPQTMCILLSLISCRKMRGTIGSRIETHLVLTLFAILFWNHMLLVFALAFIAMIIINKKRSK